MYTSAVTLNIQNQCVTPNYWHTARNFLTGRVMVNWEAKLLVFVIATKVICAVASIFSGQLTFALIFLLSAMFDGILRRKLIDTDFHKVKAGLDDTSVGLKLTNVQLDSRVKQLQKQIDGFAKQLGELEEERNKLAAERNKFETSNTDYAELNKTHLALITSMKNTTSDVSTTAMQLISNGTTATQKQINAFKEAAAKLEQLSESALELQKHQKSGVAAYIEQFSSALDYFKSNQLEAAKELGGLQKAREAQEQERENWKIERENLKKEITRLNAKNEELSLLIKQLGKVITDATTATGINVQSSNTLKKLINRMVFTKEYLPMPGIPITPERPWIEVGAS